MHRLAEEIENRRHWAQIVVKLIRRRWSLGKKLARSEPKWLLGPSTKELKVVRDCLKWLNKNVKSAHEAAFFEEALRRWGKLVP